MKAEINTDEVTDEGEVLATRLCDEWYLFRSYYDGSVYYVEPSVVSFI